nr:hypothetical protein [Providencia rettgeri]
MTDKKNLPWQLEELRDKFAMAAMQGDLASQSVSLGHFANDASEESLVNRANFYYRMADAMLKARGWYMGKMTFVVEYEDGKEPPISFNMEIFGGKVIEAGFRDYNDDMLTEAEIEALMECLNISELENTSASVDVDILLKKLGITLVRQ